MASWKDYANFILSKGNVEEVLIIDSKSGAPWAFAPETFQLREYTATIAQEDGSDKDEFVNEVKSILTFIQGTAPPHGLRLNKGKKQQIIRSFKDEATGLQTIIGKIAQGGSCVAHAGKCILIGTYSEMKGHTSAGCNDVIQLMAMYLSKSTWPEESTLIPSPSSGGVSSNTGAASVGGGGGGSASPAQIALWQPFLDSLVGTKQVAQALIMSKTDGTIFVSTPKFGLKVYETDIPQDDGSDKAEQVNETKNILTLVNEKKKTPQGLRIDEMKFQVLRMFDEDKSGCFTVYGKKAAGGCALVQTNQAILLAIFDEALGNSAAGCNEALSETARQIKASGN